MTAQMYLKQRQLRLKQVMADVRVRRTLTGAAYAGAGFFLSAISLAGGYQSVAMGLTAAMDGWRAVAVALGSIVGYGLFGGTQGIVWAALACATALLLGKWKVTEEAPLLLPAMTAMWVALTGLLFQMLGWEDGPVPLYLLRVGLGAASAWLFARLGQQPVTDWLAMGIGVLALAQVCPVPWLNFGCMAAAALALSQAFPAAALAGAALDLAGVSQTPMTAVLCGIYMIRLIPGLPDWVRRATPAAVYLAVMGLAASSDWYPALPLALGGAASVMLPPRPEVSHRQGETGLAQVRLEMMAGVLTQTRQILLEIPALAIDEAALVARAKEQACGGCPHRKVCKNQWDLPLELLHKPLYDSAKIPPACRKPGRMIMELRRSQEQYRNLRAQRDRREEYRGAVSQQYGFLAAFLRDLSDQLARRGERAQQRYQAETGVSSAGKEAANGDKCLCFYGSGCRYYVLLCDGMGTGLGAEQEGKTAAELLRRMLTAGFPADHALKSLNSLLVLRGWAGAVTVDLAEIRLDNGRGTLYKWGAAPSYIAAGGSAKKIGTAGPPPGLGIEKVQETVERLSLRRGEMLILLSDGVDGEAVLNAGRIDPGAPPGEVAARLLERGGSKAEDDATVAVLRLTNLSA